MRAGKRWNPPGLAGVDLCVNRPRRAAWKKKLPIVAMLFAASYCRVTSFAQDNTADSKDGNKRPPAAANAQNPNGITSPYRGAVRERWQAPSVSFSLIGEELKGVAMQNEGDARGGTRAGGPAGPTGGAPDSSIGAILGVGPRGGRNSNSSVNPFVGPRPSFDSRNSEATQKSSHLFGPPSPMAMDQTVGGSMRAVMPQSSLPSMPPAYSVISAFASSPYGSGSGGDVLTRQRSTDAAGLGADITSAISGQSGGDAKPDPSYFQSPADAQPSLSEAFLPRYTGVDDPSGSNNGAAHPTNPFAHPNFQFANRDLLGEYAKGGILNEELILYAATHSVLDSQDDTSGDAAPKKTHGTSGKVHSARLDKSSSNLAFINGGQQFSAAVAPLTRAESAPGADSPAQSSDIQGTPEPASMTTLLVLSAAGLLARRRRPRA